MTYSAFLFHLLPFKQLELRLTFNKYNHFGLILGERKKLIMKHLDFCIFEMLEEE